MNRLLQGRGTTQDISLPQVAYTNHHTELRRFGLDKGADGQVVDARGLEDLHEFFEKNQTNFSPQKNRNRELIIRIILYIYM